jgi:predicted NUDIX family phosphoesterase
MNQQELQKKYGDVKVYAVENAYIKEMDKKFKSYPADVYEKLIGSNGTFILRYKAELDECYRQIIPYCMIKKDGKYFVTQRLKGDARLVGRYSLGIGGHMEKIDYNDNTDFIQKALRREMYEEVYIDGKIDDIKLIGTICSNATAVDRVHYGMVYLAHISSGDVRVREVENLKGKWMTRDELLGEKDQFEVWSQICIENI